VLFILTNTEIHRQELQGKLAIMLTHALKDYGGTKEEYILAEISPGSVMMTPGDLTYKISEFTSASSDADAYYAPEQLEAETGPGDAFDQAMDVWGTAATLLPCACLQRPASVQGLQPV
jgi:hypothetical protein